MSPPAASGRPTSSARNAPAGWMSLRTISRAPGNANDESLLEDCSTPLRDLSLGAPVRNPSGDVSVGSAAHVLVPCARHVRRRAPGVRSDDPADATHDGRRGPRAGAPAPGDAPRPL